MKSNELNRLTEITKKMRVDVFTKYRKRFGNDLCGCCAIASGIMFERLKKEFPSVEIVMSERSGGDSHCFILYKEYIFDITASQFGCPDVCIFKQEKFEMEESGHWFWYGDRTYFNDVKKLKEYQNEGRWPYEQIYWSDYYKKRKN
jgi:hypothetical protein